MSRLGKGLQKTWNVKVKIVPLVVGSLSAIPKQFGNKLKQIGITAGTAQDSTIQDTEDSFPWNSQNIGKVHEI